MERVPSESLPSGVVLVDARRRIVDASALAVEWFGMPASELIGQPIDRLAVRPEKDRSPDSEYLPAVAEITHPDGSMLPVLVAEGAPDDDGNRYITLFNAREQRAFRQELQARHTLTQRTQTRLELVIAASIAFSEASDEQELADVLVRTMASAYAAEDAVVFLLDDDMVFQEVAGASPFKNLEDVGAMTAAAMQLRTVTKISGVEAAYAAAHAVGVAFEASGVQSIIIAPIHQRDVPLGIVAAFFHHPRTFDEQASPLADALAGQAARAISALRLQQRLEHAARHDDTTGLPNRRLLDEWTLSPDPVDAAFVGVLFVDLDDFKAVNDQLGHHMGDLVLREVGLRLQATVREHDTVARFGGDEFVIVCELPSAQSILEMAERVKDSVRIPYSILPAGLELSASVGVSATARDSGFVGSGSVLRAADEAMYRAKQAGGDQVAFTLLS